MPTGITGFIYNIIFCQKKTFLFQRVILKETLVLMCLASVCLRHFRQLKEIVGHRDIYFSKEILNYFVCVEVCFLVEK